MGEGEAKEKKNGFWKSKGILIVGAVLAVLLIVIGGADVSQGKRQAEQPSSNDSADPLYQYTQELERKIATLCESVEGVDRVEVAVSLVGDFSYVYATDSDTQAADGKTQSSVQYVTVGSGSSEQTVLVTRSLPTIGGIGIVCHGGGDGALRQELISLISTTFGIGTNKIYIARTNMS